MYLFGVFLLASWLVGYLTISLAAKTLPMIERLLMAPLIGMGILTFGIFLISLVYPAIYTAFILETALLLLVAGSCVVYSWLPAWLMADVNEVAEWWQQPWWKKYTWWELVPATILALTVLVMFLNYAWGPYDWDVVTLYDFRARVLAERHELHHLYDMTSGEGDRFVYYFSYPLMTSIWHAIVYIGGSEFVLFPYAVLYGCFFLLLWQLLKRSYQSSALAAAVLALTLVSPDYILQAQTAYTNFPFTVYFTLGMIYLFLSFKKQAPPLAAGILIACSMWVRFVDPFYYVVLVLLGVVAIWKRDWRYVVAMLPILVVRQVWGTYLHEQVAPYSQSIEAFSLGSLWQIVKDMTVAKMWEVPQVVVFVLRILIKTLKIPLFLLVSVLIMTHWKKLPKYWLEALWFSMVVGIVMVGGILFAFLYPDWQDIPGSAERMFSSLPPTLYFILGWLLVDLWGNPTSTTQHEKISEIKLIKSTFYNEAQTKQDLIAFIKQAPMLSFNEQCQLFETNFATYQGRREAVTVNSGSSANLAMIQALLNMGRLKHGDKVGFSALTWSTNVMPLIQLGLYPVPIDVELDTLNVSSRTLKSVLNKQPLAAVFITNLLGWCDDIDQIEHVCQREGIILLEDNCESMGTVYKGRKLGNYSLASSFSFYVGHHMSTVEGGMVCTDDEEFATMLRLVRAHGWDRNLALAQQEKMRTTFNVNSTFYSRYTFYELGYNLRPTEMTGFLGNNQLQYIDEIVTKRNHNFMELGPAIYAQSDKYYPIKYDHIDFLSNFAVPVVCRTQKLRDKLVKACAGKLEIRPVVGGDMTQQPFFDKHVEGYQKFIKNSNSKLIHEQGLYFGNNPELTPAELAVIKEIFTR